MAMPIGGLEGVGPKMEDRLIELGIVSVQMLANMNLEDLTAVEGIGEKTAEGLLEKAREISNRIQREYLSQIRKEQAEANVEAGTGKKTKSGIESLFLSDEDAADKAEGEAAQERDSEELDATEVDEVSEKPKGNEEEIASAE